MTPIATSSDKNKKVFNEDTARSIANEVSSYLHPKAPHQIIISSWWGAGQRWARNRASLTADQREVTVRVGRGFRGLYTNSAVTNQTDSVSLKGMVDTLEFFANRNISKVPVDYAVDDPTGQPNGTVVWSDETYAQSVTDTARVIQSLTTDSATAAFMSAGYIEATGCTALYVRRDEWGRVQSEWGRVTQASCSMTVRAQKGSGSGWAGRTSYDSKLVDISELGRIAFEKCKKSIDPVRIEPGRYQVILEPAATMSLTDVLLEALIRYLPETYGSGPMALGRDAGISRFRSKLGLRIIDERLNLFHDTSHPQFGSHFSPLHGRRDFITNGVLTQLWDTYSNHVNEVVDGLPSFQTTSYTLKGGEVSLQEMIESSKRAILVSKLYGTDPISRDTLLYSGFTRDGLWLIENGVVTKAVRNFRFTESPLFALNNVEQIGREEQVFAPNTSRDPFGSGSFAWSLNNIVVPPLKINDFSFTSTIDAI